MIDMHARKTPKGYYYLASPYSAHTASLRLARYRLARSATAALLARGLFVHSPILHCHDLAETHDLPKDYAFWSEYNHAMISRSDGLVIAMIPGWERSVGVRGEFAFAKRIGLPVSGFAMAEDGSWDWTGDLGVFTAILEG